ncbi:Cytochrome P450 [Rhynchospora pubera]|uniref:Cytochrome P450 n=1 Tax=Rhynchospora pubera TaxID=906938 RepID=A0AAV8BX41_9POAL|nr:Cytochrome P450 [Rhynchospora pubera]
MTGADSDPVLLSLTLPLVTVIAILLVSIFWIYGRKNGADSKLPPGDKGWPIVGYIFSPFKPHPATTLGDYLNIQFSRYGKIFSTRYRGKTVIISADCEFNRFVLQNEQTLFQNNLPLGFKKFMGEGSLPFLTGDVYRSKKSLMVAFFNSWQIQSRFLAEVEEAAKAVMTSWRQRRQILADEEINKFLFNIAIEKAMGMTPDDHEVEELRKAFIAAYDGFYAVPTSLPFTRYSKALKARDIICSIVKRKAEDRMLRIDKMDEKENDLLWYCLKNSSLASIPNICDEVVGFIFAALLNTQNTIALAIYLLGKCPKSLRQLRDEFKQTDTDELANLTWDAYKNMEFCQSVINETLRLGNIVPRLWRKTLSDVNYKGYIIPQGTTVITHIAAMHLDPSAFENPNIFDPWRWLVFLIIL